MYVVISVYTTSFSWTLLSPSKILTKMWYLGWVEEERVGTIWRYLNYFYCCKTKIYPIQINVCNRKYFSAALSHARGTISLMQHYLKLVRPFLLMQHLLRSSSAVAELYQGCAWMREDFHLLLSGCEVMYEQYMPLSCLMTTGIMMVCCTIFTGIVNTLQIRFTQLKTMPTFR